MYDAEIIKEFIPKEDRDHFLVFENIYRNGDFILAPYRMYWGSNNLSIHIDEYENRVKSKNRNEMIEDILSPDPGHYCPYCGHKEMLINNHFAHIEFEHPNMSLI